MHNLDLAWAAGLVDGEGCIAITRYAPTPGTRCISYRYTLVLKVAMCHRPTVLRVARILGVGSVQNHMNCDKRWSASYAWIAQSKLAAAALRELLPYLVTKRKEAEVALAFADLPLAARGGNGGSSATRASLMRKRERLYWRLRKLKSRWKFYAQKL